MKSNWNRKEAILDGSIHSGIQRSNSTAQSYASTVAMDADEHLQHVTQFTSSGQPSDEPHAVFALGNFFGNGNVFIGIPWQSLQLAKPSKSLNIKIFPAASVSDKLERMNIASVEIKRDASGCIQVTARKNSNYAARSNHIKFSL